MDLKIKLANQKVEIFARTNCLLSQIYHDLVVISDVHLLDAEEERGKLLLKFLTELDGTKIQNFVLLGDIFDFCFGASPYFQRKFDLFGKQLSRLAREGTKVFFIEGNHEFLIQELFWEGVSFVKEKELKLTLSDDSTILFTHGDYLKAPWHYRLYSYIIRSQLSKFFALKIPQKFLNRLALAISAKSRRRSYSKAIPHKEILQNLTTWISGRNVSFGIVGHFHVPYDYRPSEKTRIFCLDSWDKPNCLSYSSGRFQRLYLKNTGINKVELDP